MARASASRPTSMSRSASGATRPTGTVRAAAPRARVRSTARRSSSEVVTPGTAAATRRSRTSCTSAHAAPMRSISSGDLRTIRSRALASRGVRSPRRGCGRGRALAPEGLLRRGEDPLGRADALDVREEFPVAVEAAERLGLRGVLLEPPAHRLGLVVLALHEPRIVAVAEAVAFRGVLRDVVDGAALRARAAAAHALDEHLLRHVVRDAARDGAPERVEEQIEVLRLRGRSRVAVEDEARRDVGAAEPLLHHLVRDVVGDEPADVHDGLDLLADGGAARLVVAEHVARRDVLDAELGREQLRLRALAGTRRPEKDEDHVRPPKREGARLTARPAASRVGDLARREAATADAGAAGAGEALVVAGDEMPLDLLHGVERHADHDQERRPAEVELDV